MKAIKTLADLRARSSERDITDVTVLTAEDLGWTRCCHTEGESCPTADVFDAAMRGLMPVAMETAEEVVGEEVNGWIENPTQESRDDDR